MASCLLYRGPEADLMLEPAPFRRRSSWFLPWLLRAAVNDASLGDWDEAEGRHAGRLDDGARSWGATFAEDAAASQAADDAAARIEQLFATLDGWPEPEPPPPAPGFTPEIELPPASTLEEMFEAWPPAALPDSLEPVRRIFAGWDLEPWWLCRRSTVEDVMERIWTDPGRGFVLWLADPRRDPTWERLEPGLRDDFRAAFNSGFRAALEQAIAGLVADAWQHGFAAGWSWLEIEGPVLEAPRTAAIELPPRRASRTPLEARLRVRARITSVDCA